MITTPLVTATVTHRTGTKEVELAVTGAPPIEVRSMGAREIFHPTGLHIAYADTETTTVTIRTTTDDLSVRLDMADEDPVDPWVTTLVDEHRPDPRAAERTVCRLEAAIEIVERARRKGVTSLDTDILAEALGLDEDDEAREPEVDGAGRTRAEYGTTTVDPCLPYQRYGCGHCPHQNCPNPNCGHCPCNCECR